MKTHLHPGSELAIQGKLMKDVAINIFESFIHISKYVGSLI